MDMETLLELKRQYELELIRAEAKVTVINDIIASQKPTPPNMSRPLFRMPQTKTPQTTN